MRIWTNNKRQYQAKTAEATISDKSSSLPLIKRRESDFEDTEEKDVSMRITRRSFNFPSFRRGKTKEATNLKDSKLPQYEEEAAKDGDDMPVDDTPVAETSTMESSGSSDESARYATDDIWTACKVGDEDFVRHTIGVTKWMINQPDKQGRTPLYYACLCGHTSIVKMLLDAGAKDEEGIAYTSALNLECRQLLKKKNKKRVTFNLPEDDEDSKLDTVHPIQREAIENLFRIAYDYIVESQDHLMDESLPAIDKNIDDRVTRIEKWQAPQSESKSTADAVKAHAEEQSKNELCDVQSNPHAIKFTEVYNGVITRVEFVEPDAAQTEDQPSTTTEDTAVCPRSKGKGLMGFIASRENSQTSKICNAKEYSPETSEVGNEKGSNQKLTGSMERLGEDVSETKAESAIVDGRKRRAAKMVGDRKKRIFKHLLSKKGNHVSASKKASKDIQQSSDSDNTVSEKGRQDIPAKEGIVEGTTNGQRFTVGEDRPVRISISSIHNENNKEINRTGGRSGQYDRSKLPVAVNPAENQSPDVFNDSWPEIVVDEATLEPFVEVQLSAHMLEKSYDTNDDDDADDLSEVASDKDNEDVEVVTTDCVEKSDIVHHQDVSARNIRGSGWMRRLLPRSRSAKKSQELSVVFQEEAKETVASSSQEDKAIAMDHLSTENYQSTEPVEVDGLKRQDSKETESTSSDSAGDPANEVPITTKMIDWSTFTDAFPLASDTSDQMFGLKDDATNPTRRTTATPPFPAAPKNTILFNSADLEQLNCSSTEESSVSSMESISLNSGREKYLLDKVEANFPYDEDDVDVTDGDVTDGDVTEGDVTDVDATDVEEYDDDDVQDNDGVDADDGGNNVVEDNGDDVHEDYEDDDEYDEGDETVEDDYLSTDMSGSFSEIMDESSISVLRSEMKSLMRGDQMAI